MYHRKKYFSLKKEQFGLFDYRSTSLVVDSFFIFFELFSSLTYLHALSVKQLSFLLLSKAFSDFTAIIISFNAFSNFSKFLLSVENTLKALGFLKLFLNVSGELEAFIRLFWINSNAIFPFEYVVPRIGWERQ